MKIVLHKQFEKKYSKLEKKLKVQFKERRDLFLKNPFHPTLHNHALSGEYIGLRSINITGDLRALYKEQADDIVIFMDIDTHSNLYG